MEISQTEFEKFLQDGDISKVVVVNKHQARIYLFPEALKKPDHKSVSFLIYLTCFAIDEIKIGVKGTHLAHLYLRLQVPIG